jgi:hypothetical protein
VLPETKVVDGVTCGVLEEKETKDGKLIEISRNFFATDPGTNDVYYFGEDVDNYKDGKIISHESAWLAGEKGARFGLMIPGKPKFGDKFYQEIAPKVAMDRVEVASTNAKVKTPVGWFENWRGPEGNDSAGAGRQPQVLRPGIGMIKDDDFELAEKNPRFDRALSRHDVRLCLACDVCRRSRQWRSTARRRKRKV